MVFSSTVFVFFFLPLCLLLYFVLPGLKAKNLVLLLFSLVFYAWGEPVYIILMILSILLNYTVGIYMEKIPEWRKGILIAGLIVNLGLLGFFKYYGFAVEIINRLSGLHLSAHTLPLPIGISFYTFQALSYVIDLYRGKIGVQKNPLLFGLYISLFPQLIAGPIVRYSEVEKALGDRTVSFDGLGEGMARFLFGLGKKVLLANTLGAVFDRTGLQTGPASVLTAWIGLIAFSLQLYFDFSGYSDMAIGLGKMLGFDFPENFRMPYASGSITEFWRRWHMTLGSWFREYVYIPLGGSRAGTRRQIFNILIVWMLTGLWHGAAWNFVLWGLYYGVLLLLEKLVIFRFKKMPKWIGHVYTVFLVFLGWGMFLCGSLSEVGQVFTNLFGLGGAAAADAAGLWLLRSDGVLLGIGALFCLPCFLRLREKLMTERRGALTVVCALLFVLCSAFLVAQSYNPFLYFRF
ncbi:MAG: MBOAT family protein [Lachnospiraceae bacterium]|nr:MBOAT family protein [Lachnospiraceae bacterium]